MNCVLIERHAGRVRAEQQEGGDAQPGAWSRDRLLRHGLEETGNRRLRVVAGLPKLL